MCRSNQELKEKLYSFTLAEEETDKLSFLRSLCRQMANTVCKADAVSTVSEVFSVICYVTSLEILSPLSPLALYEYGSAL
jgi:Sec7-like guanine-nucleotide exchange factor